MQCITFPEVFQVLKINIKLFCFFYPKLPTNVDVAAVYKAGYHNKLSLVSET